MTDIIKKDEIDKLKFVLNYSAERSYIESVKEVQEFMEENLELKEMPIINYFAPDIYMRQMDAKAGDLVVSKMHRTEHMNILLKGSISILTEDGVQYLEAPVVLKSRAGTKRIGYFHEDSSWLTIHPNQSNETDDNILVDSLTVPEEEAELFLNSLEVKELSQ